jgi:hypothetical protein
VQRRIHAPFGLEALEPRVLLSAQGFDDSPAAPALIDAIPLASELVIESSPVASSWLASPVSYSPAESETGIFDHLPDCADLEQEPADTASDQLQILPADIPEPGVDGPVEVACGADLSAADSGTGDADAVASEVGEITRGDLTDCLPCSVAEDSVATISAAAATVGANALTVQLTETLRAANGPPSPCGSVVSVFSELALADSEERGFTSESVSSSTLLDVPLQNLPVLSALLEEAISHWAQLGLDQDLVARLRQVRLEVVDLPGGALAQANGEVIQLDQDAAGHGWFVDVTPADHSEFKRDTITGVWRADSTGPALGRVDLISVLSHELGHVLGFEDLDHEAGSAAVMAAILMPGQRRLAAESSEGLGLPTRDYGTIVGANLTIAGPGGSQVVQPSTSVPVGDLQSITANTDAQASELAAFFGGTDGDGQVSFGGTITVAGQALEGAFFLKLQNGEVQGAASAVTASMMSDDVGVRVTAGNGGFILASTGTALSVEGTAAFVNVPGLRMFGSLAVRINTLGTEAPASMVIPGTTSTLTFGFSGNVNGFEASSTKGSPGIQIWKEGSPVVPLIDISGNMRFTGGGTEVLVVDISNLNVTIYASGVEVFSVDTVYGKFTLGGSSQESDQRGWRLVAGSISAKSTSGHCEIAGVNFTQNTPDEYTYAVVGPFKMNGATPLLAAFAYHDRSLKVNVGAYVDNLKLAWEKGEGQQKKEYSFEFYFADFTVGLEATISSTTDAATGNLTGSGLFRIYTMTGDVKIGDFLTGSAYNISAQYNPDGPNDQEIVRAEYLDITITPIRLQFQLRPYTDNNGAFIPGLVVRLNGFQMGRGKAILKEPAPGNPNDPQSPERMVGFKTPFIEVFDLGFTAGEAFSFSGAVSVGAEEVRIGKKDSPFAANGTNVVGTLEFTDNLPSGFQFRASSLTIRLTSYIEVSATTFIFHPSAIGTEEIVHFNELTATLKLGGVGITGSIRAFGINGDGTFVTHAGFGASFSIGEEKSEAATGGLKWPAWLPIKSASVGVEWPSFSTNPENFRLVLGISIDTKLGSIALTGSVTGAVIDIGLLLQGKFPLISLESFTVGAKGTLGGAEVDGSLVLGIVRFDEYGVRIPGGDVTTPVADSIFYGGIDAGLTIAGKGFHLRLGLSEKGPLSAYISIDAPIILEPTSGLTIDNFRGGITFNALPFPTIDTTAGLDSVASQLRSPRFRPAGELKVEQWQAQLEQQVINQAGGQYGYLFSITDTPENIQKHVVALNTTATILDEMTNAFLDRGYGMSSGFASVTRLQTDWAWIVSYQGADYLVEKRVPDTGSDHLLNISRLQFALLDIPPPLSASVVGDLDAGTVTAAIQQMFSDGGVVLSNSASIKIKTTGEEWFVYDGDAEYLLRLKGPNSEGKYALVVMAGTAGSLKDFDLGVIKIEAGCTLYFQATSKEALRGEMDLAVTTEGQILLSGKLIFANGKLTATAKLYADLRQIASGSGALYFLMDVPDEPRVLSIVGTLTFGFVDSQGNALTRQTGETVAQFYDRIEAMPDVAYRIDLAGKGLLTAGGFLGITCEGHLSMTFSKTRFELTFDVKISIEGLISADSLVSAAGILVVQNSGGSFEMWGVMKFNIDSSTLEPLAAVGIFFEADVILKLNIGGPAEGRDVTLTLPGRPPETFHLPKNSFALYLYGDAEFAPGEVSLLKMTGAFSLEISQAEGFQVFLLASFWLGPKEFPLIAFEALGLVSITGDGFAARLDLARRMQLPGILVDGNGAALDITTPGISYSLEMQLYMNTTSEAVVYELPEEFAEKLGKALPADLAARIEGGQVSIPAGAPRLAGLFLTGVGTNGAYITALDGGSIPDTLKASFRTNGSKLMSTVPTVTTLVAGSAWIITDQVTNDGETYLARYLVEKSPGGKSLLITSLMFMTGSTDAVVSGLNSGSIPSSISQLFADNSLALAGNATVSVLEPGAAWLITSGANRYLLEKHGSQLLIMKPREGPAEVYFVLAGGGSLSLLDTFVLEGRFRIQASASGFQLEVYAGLELGVLGHLRAAGILSITKDGLVTALELELEAGLPLGPGVGIRIEGKFALAINTTNAAVSVDVPIAGGSTKSIALAASSIQVHVEGSIDFLGFIQASGWVDIFLSNQQFTLEGQIAFALSNAISASAGVLIKVTSSGVVACAYITLNVKLPSPSIPIFSINASGTLQLNTTNANYTWQYKNPVTQVTSNVVLAKKSFLLDLNGELSVLGVLKLDAGFKIQVGGGTFTHAFGSTINTTPYGDLGPANYSQTLQSGDWAIGFSANLSFFGLATLGASGWLNSAGSFDIRVAGELIIGTRSFGLMGEFHFRVWLNESQFGLRVGATVGAKLFGITLASIGFDASFTADRGANSSGSVSIDMSVTVQIQILFVKFSKTANFHVGTLQLPPVPNLATKEADGTLRLNTGTRADLRGVGKTEINETYYIEHVAAQTGDPAGERIRVTAFGYSEEYTGVTKIVGDAGTGNDCIFVRPNQDNQLVTVPVELNGGIGNDVLVYDGQATTGTITLTGGDGNDYLEIGENCTATVVLSGGDGDDQLIHHGSGAGTLDGGAGSDQIVGGSGPDTITGGDGDDEITGRGGIDKIDAGNGNDIIYWRIGDGLDTGLTAGTPVTGGAGIDTFHYTGSAAAERFRISGTSSNLVIETLGPAGNVTGTFTATGVEKLYIDAAGGADQIEVMDLTSTPITQVAVDLGRVIASTTTVIVGQDLDGDGEPDTDPVSGRLLAPEKLTVHTYAKDNAADVLTIHGRNNAADHLLVYTDTTWLLEGDTLNEVRVKRDGADHDAFLIYNGQRNNNTSQTDRLIIQTGGGNDIIDASGVVDADLLALELVGGTGNDTLIGSPYADVLDGGMGDDIFTGGAGTDTFRDAGGFDTLVEAMDKDLGLFGNRFVAGTITNLLGGQGEEWALRNGPQDDVWNADAEVEDLTGGTGTCLFEEARISGGAGSNIMVVGDRNNSIRVGSDNIAVTPWAAKVTLDNKTNSGENLAPERYIINLTGTGTGNVWIEDSGGSVGSDTLWIFGTDAADSVTLDKQTIDSVVYGKVLVASAGSSLSDVVYYREIEQFAVSTLGGNDVLQLNDNLNTTYIYTGSGDDSVTIGYVATVLNNENVPVVDLANTTNGVSAETFIYGGAGNDRFEINHNRAVLWLFGEEDDDRFVQYSFLVDLNSTTLPLSSQDNVTLSGGSGSNEYQLGDPGPLGSTRYVWLQNNLVHIEGGSGTDTFVIVGSPLADYFILTANYLLGGGLNTTFSGIEVLELDTGGGDDVVYVLGSSSTMDVRVVTGSGNDIVHIGGEAPPMKVVLPAHLVTPDPVLRQDMRKIYPFYTHPAFSNSSTFSGTDNLAAPVTLNRIVDGTAYYYWYYPSGVSWNAWKSSVVNAFSALYAATHALSHYQAQLPVDAYPGYSFLSTTGETAYLQSALGGVRLDQTTRSWVWDDRAWNQHEYVYYTVQFNYTLPAVTYVDEFNWRYMAPYAYSPPTTQVPGQEFWVMLPRVDTLTGFQGKVTVDGGDSTYEQNGQQIQHIDKLFIHNENGGASTNGQLSSTALTGLGLSSDGIQYSHFEELDLRLGANNDSFTINGTHAGKTDIVLGAGNDSVTVKALGGETNILGGAGADTVTVQGNSTSGLGGIAAKLHFRGNAHRYETSTGTGVYQPVANLDANGLPVMEWIPFTQLPQSIFTDAAVFSNTGAILEGQTQWQYGTQQFDTDNRTPLLQSFTVQRQQVATTSTQVRTVTTHNTTVTDSSTDRLVVTNSSYSANTTGTVSSTWVTGLGMAVGIQYEQLEDLSVTLGGGVDTLTVTGLATPAQINGGPGGDTIHVQNGNQALTVNGDAGADVIIVQSISAVTTVNGGADNDTVYVRQMSAALTINGGTGDDIVNVGSTAGATPATAGNVNSISALLTVNGDGDSDTLNVDDTGDTAANTGTLTGTQLTGLGMNSGITYGTLEAININLGSGGDSFTIESTHSGTTTVNSNAGQDTVRIKTISGPTNINTGIDRDTVNVWNDSTCLDSISALLTVNMDDPTVIGAGDLLDIRDTGNTTGRSGTLTASTLTGLGMSGSISYSAVELLDLRLGSGPDVLRIKSISAVTKVNTGSGDDQINVWNDANQLAGIAQVLTIDAGDPTASDSLTISDTGTNTATTGTLTGSTLLLSSMPGSITYSHVETLTISLGSGGDTFVIASTHAAMTVLNAGPGNDTVTAETIAGVTTINGEADVDTINVRTINAATTVNGGAGNDTINVGSTAGATPASGGNVKSISALLTVNGNDGSDTLNVDDTSDTAANTGTLTSSQLTGLGMNNGITYGTLEAININLGSGGDNFTIESTHSGTTTVNSNAGQDTVRIKTISGPTNINTGIDRDTVNIWNDSTCLDSISALLTVNMGDPTVIGAGDLLDIRDTGNTAGRSGTLTASTLTGLGMSGSISYSAVELLDLRLGSGPDVLRIKSISAVTNVHTGAGDDQINVWNDTNQLAGIAQVLTIDAGDPTASDSLTISDTGSSAATTGTLSGTSLTLSSMPGSITYSHVETLTISLGSGGDTFVIASTHAAMTVLNAGPGNDTVTAETIAGVTTINGEADVDTINVRTINAATTVNGGAGNDTINVGSTAGATPASGGNVNSISALLTVNGNDGSDTLNVDDTGDTAANTGTLTSSQLTGLGMNNGITYGTLEAININLGSGGDNFTIESTHANTTTVETNAGVDTVRVKTVAGATYVNTGIGRDTIEVWNDSNTLDDIDATLTINAGEPTALDEGDLLDVRDTGSTGNRNGIITNSSISGLGMGGVINYSAVEELDLTLGAFQDVLWIKSISAVTTVLTGAGDDQISVWDDSYRLQGISQLLTINAGEPAASDSLDIRDTGNTDPVTGTLTNGTLTLSSMVGPIVYQAVESLTVSLGSGGDTFTIQTTHTNSTVVNTGGGEDTVTVETIAGVTTINGEGGNDLVQVRTISATTTVNGGDGNDTINVGSTATLRAAATSTASQRC